MSLMFFTTHFFHYIFGRFGVPAFVTQVLAGLFLGPRMLGSIHSLGKLLYSLPTQDIIGTLTLFGYSMFLFLVGVKMDPTIVLRAGNKALYTGIGSLLVPISFSLLGILLLKQHGGFLTSFGDVTNLVFAAITYSQTSFPVIAFLLNELKLVTSELGRLALSSALVSDLFSLFFRTIAEVVFGALQSRHSAGAKQAIIENTASLLGYLFVVIFLARPAMFWIIKQTPKGKPVHSGYLFMIVLAALGSGLLSTWFGQYFFFGPLILGLAVPDGPPLGSALVQQYDYIVCHVFLPLFVTSNVMLMDPLAINIGTPVGKSTLIILFISIAAKLGGGLAPAFVCKMPLMDALVLATILSCKGVVDLAAVSIVTDKTTLGDDVYITSMLAIILSSIVVPMLVKYLYKPSSKYAAYQQRNISCLKPNSELRILSCIHKQENISAIINFLDACTPTKDNPMSIYVLHLIQMFGQAAPLFISHRRQKKTISNCSYSEDVLLSFLHFERDFRDGVTLHPFTSVCPSESMHEDVCNLAIDRVTSLIILPFHRHWTRNGAVKSEDEAIRYLNMTVLERAPCSVGILVNRGPLTRPGTKNTSSSQTSQYKVALIFLGGEDDREALALAQRMAVDPSISLTVYNLTSPKEDSEVVDWDRVLDTESLMKFRETYVDDNRGASGYAFYREETTKNGPQTVDVLRNLVDEYDLFIVGRRQNAETPQTSGLDEWSEFPELGIVGDMLASDDFICRSSIFVVQQQQQIITA